jgi:hypothetical protein
MGRELIKSYKNEREANFLLPFRVIELGFEPKTHSLEEFIQNIAYFVDIMLFVLIFIFGYDKFT